MEEEILEGNVSNVPGRPAVEPMPRTSRRRPKKNPMKLNAKQWDRAAVMNFLFERISTSSMGVEEALKACEHPMPKREVVVQWTHEDPWCEQVYIKAKRFQMDFFQEECIRIADDATNDFMERTLNNGKVIKSPDNESIHRSKVRIDTRKWMMVKLYPQRYGDVLHMPTDKNDVGGLRAILDDIDGQSTGLPAAAARANADQK